MITLHTFLTLPHWQMILHIFPNLSNAHIALRHRTQYLHNLHEKRVNITYAAISDDSLDNIFSFHYQHQLLKIMRLWMLIIVII